MTPQRLEMYRKRLNNAIILYIVIPAFLVVMCASIYALKHIDDRHKQTNVSEIIIAADKYKILIDRNMKSATLALETFSVGAGGAQLSAEDMDATFAALKKSLPWLDGMAVLDARGTAQIEAGMPMPKGPSPERPEHPSAMVTDVQADPEGFPRFFIMAGTAQSPPGRSIVLSANAFLFSAMLDRERIGRTGEIFLINESGMLQTGSVLHGGILDRVDETLAGTGPKTGTVLRRDWKGTELLYTVLPLDSVPGWRLVVQRDAKELTEARNSVSLRFAALGLLCLIVLGAAAVRARNGILEIHARMDEEKARSSNCELQVQKLDAISQLGVGLAHEVNNPLAIIGEEAGWMQDVLRRESFKDIPDAGELRDSLRQIVTQTARSREITHKLLSFGGKTDGTIRDVEMNTLVTDVVVLRRREASQKNIEIREELAEKLPIILSEPALLRQLLINLINNSMDAMPDGGTIIVATTPGDDGGVRLEVRDTGFGIPHENLNKIFDPFFTTKPPGKGAGLGLSISHGILQRVGGRISVASTPGQGTTVTVELPVEARQRTS
mgnify:CR=1 FL=1